MNVTVVSVLFNSHAVVQNQLEALPDEVPIVWVDNGSSDVAAVRALAATRNIRLVQNDINEGFGKACNQGFELAQTDYVLFLNPDATINPDALAALLSAAKKYPTASAFNPLLDTGKKLTLLKRSSVLLPRRQWPGRRVPDRPKVVHVLSGAALLVRSDAFAQVAGFDEEIFLYHEDDDLSLRLQATCGPLMIVPDAVVSHNSGHSSPRTPEIAALKAWHLGRSRVYAARKHKRPYPQLRAALVAAMQLLSPVVLVSKRKRAKQVAFLRAVLSR